MAAGHRVSRKGVDIVEAIQSLPPLPAVALRVIQVAQDPKASAADLALVVSADPGLSIRVLRVANSAMYRRTREVTSVQEALVVLGFIQARNIAVASAITRDYSPDLLRNALFRIETFWRHSITVALKAADIAQKSHQVDAPSAFTAGILHNMGRLAMFYADPAGLDQAVAEAIATGRPIEQIEAEELGYNHAELGGLLAMKWKLPSEIRDAIARHHHADLPEKSLAGIVAAADQFCIQNRLYPGYVIPGVEGDEFEVSDAFRAISRQVNELMVLVTGDAPHVQFVE